MFQLTGNLAHWLDDGKKSTIMLSACILLFACAAVLLASYMLSVEVGYVVALALGLMGTVFWVNAE